MSRNRRTHASKFLSLVLRHRPELVGITLDQQGWVPIDTLLAALEAHWQPLDRAGLEAIVASCPQAAVRDQRRWYPDSGQPGHSVEVDLAYAPCEPPAALFHGTVERSLGAIRKEGLRPMDRHHIHLSPDIPTAKAVGSRRGKPVVLGIDAGRMHAEGHLFFRAANGVWLTEHVPPGFIQEHG